MAFERHFTVEDCTEIDQHTCKSIMDKHRCKKYVQQYSSLVKHHEMKTDKGAWKIIGCTKNQTSTSKNIAPK